MGLRKFAWLWAFAALAEPVLAQAAEPPSDTGRWSIQLATMRSESGAANVLTELRESHAELLDAIGAGVQPVATGSEGSSGPGSYRVISKPFPERSLAQAVCDRLRTRQVDCVVVERR